jgi:cytochrome c biogenesis protein CcmG/thiol:disulfide interchange protein DsbE
LAVGLAIGWALNTGTAAVAQVGGSAPDFTVPLIGGGSFTLSDQLDAAAAPVVLNLWASWCVPCRTETPEISAFADAHPELKVIGVAVEDTENGATSFEAEFKPSYDVGIGDDAFETAYPRLGMPVTYVITESGLVKDIFNGIVTQQVLEDLVFG